MRGKDQARNSHRFAPAREQLQIKMQYLDDALRILGPEIKKDEKLKPVQEMCNENLNKARDLLKKQVLPTNLAWSYLHQVDEDLLLLVPCEQLLGRAVDIKTEFDLNITEKAVRSAWIGESGKITEIIKKKNKVDTEERYVLREGLRTLNNQTDREFRKLSVNTLVAVISGIALGVATVAAILAYTFLIDAVSGLAGDPSRRTFGLLVTMGVIGSYLSNLLSKADFLYVQGGPSWRYFLYHLLVRPALGGFAAVFIYLLEKTKLLFSIGPDDGGTAHLLAVKATGAQAVYVYLVLAIISGFAAEKLLRTMMDRILRKLEQKAEKTKQTPSPGETGG